MINLDADWTIGGCDDLTMTGQLQTLRLIEVGVDVGLRMQQQVPDEMTAAALNAGTPPRAFA